MKSIAITLAIVLGSGLSILRADDATHSAAAAKLLDTMGVDRSMKAGFDAMLGPALQNVMKSTGMPPVAETELRKAFKAWISEDFDMEKVRNQMIVIYASAFTEAELEQLVEFYRSPLGVKTLEKMPVLMQQGAQIGMAEGSEKQPQLKARIQPILDRYARKEADPTQGIGPKPPSPGEE